MDVSFAARIIRVHSDKIAAFHGHVAGRALHRCMTYPKKRHQAFTRKEFANK